MKSEVLNIDCVKGMAKFEDDFFELAICDPPYGIGPNWTKSSRDTFFRKGALNQYQNENPPPPEYYDELFRVSKHQIIWGGNYFTEFLPPTNSWIIWDKMRDADKTFMSEGEMAWTSFKKVLRIVQYRWDGAKKCEETIRIHPHQKPVKLYEWLLLNYSAPGDRILDTHVGSGSSRIAADKLGREFTGFELDPVYFKDQNKRFANHKVQLNLYKELS